MSIAREEGRLEFSGLSDINARNIQNQRGATTATPAPAMKAPAVRFTRRSTAGGAGQIGRAIGLKLLNDGWRATFGNSNGNGSALAMLPKRLAVYDRFVGRFSCAVRTTLDATHANDPFRRAGSRNRK